MISAQLRRCTINCYQVSSPSSTNYVHAQRVDNAPFVEEFASKGRILSRRSYLRIAIIEKDTEVDARKHHRNWTVVHVRGSASIVIGVVDKEAFNVPRYFNFPRQTFVHLTIVVTSDTVLQRVTFTEPDYPPHPKTGIGQGKVLLDNYVTYNRLN
jgi:hypothetical protein